jgi:hypothetical protein
MTKSVNILPEQIIPNQGNSIASSLFLTEMDDGDDDDTGLFSQLNPTIPRLAIQISHQIQY